MSLRDYFAAKAMNGQLAASEEFTRCKDGSVKGSLARRSYEIADAMLEARKK